jgi:hypothetical protein
VEKLEICHLDESGSRRFVTSLNRDLVVVSSSHSFVSFGTKLHQLVTKEGGGGCNLYKGLFLDIFAQIHHVLRKQRCYI